MKGWPGQAGLHPTGWPRAMALARLPSLVVTEDGLALQPGMVLTSAQLQRMCT